MNDRAPRDRKGAVFDKKKSVLNYIKSEANSEQISKRFTEANIDISLIKKLDKESNSNNNLPKPPPFSHKLKSFSSQGNSPKLFIHHKSTIVNNFDPYKSLDQELSLINLENFLLKFEDDEIEQMTVKDVLTFDLKEFDNIKIKLEEFVEVASKLGDKEIILFLNEKINSVNENRAKIECLLFNFEKVEDFVVLNESMKFFFKN